MRSSLRILIGLAVAAPVLVGSIPAPSGGADGDGALAVIVNSANTCPDPTADELRAILTLKRQFWSDGKRVVLILPPTGSPAKSFLLDRVYHLSDSELRKSWANRLFAGEIVAVPTSLRTAEALVAAVRRSPGAVSVVPASAVSPGVRVLAVGGKRPAQPGYPM